MKTSQEILDKSANNSILKETGILLVLFGASLISIFGIYNTFSDYNLVHVLSTISDPIEKYANYAVALIFSVFMIILNGVNFRKKALLEKGSFLLTSIITLTILGGIVFYYATNLFYPIISLIVLGITLYLLDLVFVTIGLKGFFFFLVIFLFSLIGIYKTGYHSVTGLTTIAQIFISLILFISATYPRLKRIFLRINTGDNVDISNTGYDEDSSIED
jgi:hypothetical protein